MHPNSATPFIEVGIVEPLNNMMPMMYYPIDITVRIGERVIPFRQLPPNAESATVTDQSGESVFIACSKDALNNEIDTQMRKSAEIVNSVDYHKNRITVFGELKKQLNPELAEKEAQAKEISALKDELMQMKSLLAEFKKEASS